MSVIYIIVKICVCTDVRELVRRDFVGIVIASLWSSALYGSLRGHNKRTETLPDAL